MYKLSSKKIFKPFSNQINSNDYLHFIKKILNPDREIFICAIIYGIAISILSLSAPICVQLLINSVVFILLVNSVFNAAAIFTKSSTAMEN